MDHVSKNGDPKKLSQCSLPLTGKAVVDLIITDLAVIAVDRAGGGLSLVELAPGVSEAEVIAKTGAPLIVLEAA
jgi:3-oxoacid CoA-transferase subunit B